MLFLIIRSVVWPWRNTFMKNLPFLNGPGVVLILSLISVPFVKRARGRVLLIRLRRTGNPTRVLKRKFLSIIALILGLVPLVVIVQNTVLLIVLSRLKSTRRLFMTVMSPIMTTRFLAARFIKPFKILRPCFRESQFIHLRVLRTSMTRFLICGGWVSRFRKPRRKLVRLSFRIRRSGIRHGLTVGRSRGVNYAYRRSGA